MHLRQSLIPLLPAIGLLMVSCSPESTQTGSSESASAPTTAQAVATETRDSEVPVDVQEPGEGLLVTQTHWTNDQPIGDGLAAVTTEVAYGHITAMDYQSGEVRWRYLDPEPMMAGMLSTAGGLVFTGSQTGHAIALDAATGEELWRYRLGGGVRSQPIAYQIEGESYVAIGSGNFAGIASMVGRQHQTPRRGQSVRIQAEQLGAAEANDRSELSKAS